VNQPQHLNKRPLAVVGLSMAVILAVAAGAAGWRLYAVKYAAVLTTRHKELASLATALGHSIENQLETGTLAATQQQILLVTTQFNLGRCQVSLPDGRVIAAADVSRITAQKLPESWPARTMPPAPTVTDHTSITRRVPLRIDGRGEAVLDIEASVTYQSSLLWEPLMTGAAIWIVTVVLMILLLRTVGQEISRLSVVHEALYAFAGGERSYPALRVSDEFGPEAKAFNELINENEQLHCNKIAKHTGDLLHSHRQAKGELNSACDAMWQGLIVVDQQMHTKYVNGAATVLLGTSRQVIVGKDIAQFITFENVQNAIRSAIDGTSLQRRTFEVERKDQNQSGMLRISVRPVRRNDPAAAIIVIEDITQLRVAEEAQHAFVAQATHELRTPLTNIRLYLENLLDDNENDAATRTKSLNVINDEAQRLERIVGDMLSVAEIEAGSFQINRDDVPLQGMFEQFEAEYQQQAREEGVTLHFNLPPKMPVINGDRDKMSTAIHNLIGNALKYTPNGGRVDVNVEVDDQLLTVAVKDTGIGIDESDLERIFEKFYRANDDRMVNITGSGLGLALAREVIRLHGGDIEVHSQHNTGSTFTLTLPVQAEAA